MPSTLDPGDRKLLLIAGAILLLLIVATVVFAPAPDEAEGQGIPTTYSTTNSGAQAAYLLLRELGYRSERWEKSPTELPCRCGRKNSHSRGSDRFSGQERTRCPAGFRALRRLDHLRRQFSVSLRRKRRRCASFLPAGHRVCFVTHFRQSLPAPSLKAHRKSR